MLNKYYAKKVECDGIKFDSKKEANRYRELMLLERAGKIKNLQMQVKYELIPSQKDISGRVVERAVIYIADFVYMDISTPVHRLIVEDIKGYRNTKGGAYALYAIKRKLMLYKYGIRITEV
jgi:hypothetical protein